jgi:hypothetical protein
MGPIRSDRLPFDDELDELEPLPIVNRVLELELYEVDAEIVLPLDEIRGSASVRLSGRSFSQRNLSSIPQDAQWIRFALSLWHVDDEMALRAVPRGIESLDIKVQKGSLAFPPDAVRSWHRIQEARIEQEHMDGESLVALLSSPSLRKIRVELKTIQSEAWKGLVFPHIEEASLVGPWITDDVIESLSSWSGLKGMHLGVHPGQISASAKVMFLNSNPACAVSGSW